MTLPVAHFGEEGAYAAEAAGRLYPEAELVACHSIPDVVRAVTRGDAGCGVAERARWGGHVYRPIGSLCRHLFR